MVKCKQCGNDFDEQYCVCPKCGWEYELEEKFLEDQLPKQEEHLNKKSSGEKKFKAKLFVIIGIIVMIVIAVIIVGIILLTSNKSDSPEECIDTEYTLGNIVASGNCGKNGDEVKWELDDNGHLVISGNGEMENYGFTEIVELSIPTLITGSFKGWEDFPSSDIPQNEVYDFNEEYDRNRAPWYENRYDVKSVIVKNGVTSIGDYAFRECTSLTSITIPDSVTSIGDYAFVCCTSLTMIYVDKNNADYISVDGVLFDNSFTTLMCFPGGKAGDYIVPFGVTSIGECAFEYCNGLESVIIPNSVKCIECGAFEGCENLKTITIPNSVTSIGYSAFVGCNNLTSITIPDSVTSIGMAAFAYLTGITDITIPYSVTNIGEYAFVDWTASQTIYVKGRSKAPSDWDKNWNEFCDAKIVWDA